MAQQREAMRTSRRFPGGPVVKKPPSNAGDARDTGSIHGLGRSPGVGNDNPLQYSYLEDPIDRGAWQATVHGVSKSRTRLSTHIHTQEIWSWSRWERMKL